MIAIVELEIAKSFVSGIFTCCDMFYKIPLVFIWNIEITSFVNSEQFYSAYILDNEDKKNRKLNYFVLG